MITKPILQELYNDKKLSMAEIALELNTSVYKVRWWMDKYDIPKRSWSQATYVKRNKEGDPFKIKNRLNASEKILFGLGIGLYWGEGTKKDRGSIRLGNTDPNLIKTFIVFLQQICNLKREKIRFALQIFEDINKEKAVKYWENNLGFSRQHFLPTIVVSPRQGKGTYLRKSQYGVITLIVCNKKLRDWINDQIDLLCRGSSVGRARHW